MKIIFALITIAVMLVNTALAADIYVLSNPGPERDQIEIQYEKQREAGSATAQELGDLGIIYHMKAVQNGTNPEKVKKAYKTLRKAFSMDKSRALIRAYYGSITTMMALTADSPMKQMKFVKSGTRQMDRAVRDDPGNIDIRILRGNNSLKLPEFLQRARYAVTDFEHLLKLIEKYPETFKSRIHYSLGLAYSKNKQIEQARSEWQLAIKIAPNSKWARKADEKL